MLPGLDLVQSIFSSLSALTTNVTCPELITVSHHNLSQPVESGFSQSEEVFYRSRITTHFDTLFYHIMYLPGRVAQSVTCLATDACLTADPYFRGD